MLATTSATVVLSKGLAAPKVAVTPGVAGPVAAIHVASGLTLGTTDPVALRTLARALADAATDLEAAQDALLVTLKEV